jgi:thiamine-monophosphate kinase
MTKKSPYGETDIIQRYFAPLAENTPGAFGLADDAGLISPPEGMELVLTTDMIIEGVHFLKNSDPVDIAYKALGVNVSDLCAKGANASVYLLSIALSGALNPQWLEQLSQGFVDAQADFGCTLLGGDTVHTPGPLALSITAVGFVPIGCMVHRSGAREGDHVYVTGTIGDAALGLAQIQGADAEHLSAKHAEYLAGRHKRPQPRLEAVPVIRKYANAAMDVSDGLVGDFAKLCAASDVGGTLVAADVPLSDASAHWLAKEQDRIENVLTGGDDYELLMCISESELSSFERDCASTGLHFTRIGRIAASNEGVRVLGKDGKALVFEQLSYDHF